MTRIAISRRKLANSLTGALATVLLAGCATHAAPSASLSAADAVAAMAKGKHRQAIEHAEAAVRAEPRNIEYRAMLGDAYLDAGRFVSASSTFSDVFALGDRSPRTALSYALALTGAGLHNEALKVLSAYEGQLPAADLGLAIALAGAPAVGIHVLEEAIRSGESSVKIRQNLAYSYALAGRWKAARVMVSQDLRADLVNDRLEQWSRAANPLAWQQRVAGLLDVPAGVRDPGQPVELALANSPSIERLAEEAVAVAAPPASLPSPDLDPAPAPAVTAEPITSELPPLFAVAPVSTIGPVEAAKVSIDDSPLRTRLPAILSVAPIAPIRAVAAGLPAMSAPDLAGATRFRPLGPAQIAVQTAFDTAFGLRAPRKALPSAIARNTLQVALPAQAETRPSPPARTIGNSHLVQLGSFSSRETAVRAQSILTSRHPELAGHRMVITEAVVGGKRYWRVSAAGFGAGDSRTMCGALRARGEGCLAYAASRPLPGAVQGAIRLARR